MKKCPLAVYTVSHFLVDLACGYTLYSMYAQGLIEANFVAVLFILYNMLAFATQHLFGAIRTWQMDVCLGIIDAENANKMKIFCGFHCKKMENAVH